MPQKSEREHEIAAVIAMLLILYPQPDETPAAREAIAGVWLEDFAEFDSEVVEAAVREWRRAQKWRPSIAELRALCREEQDRVNWRAERALPKPDAPPVDPEIAKLWDGDLAEREAAIAANEARYARAAAWRADRESLHHGDAKSPRQARAMPLEPGEHPMSPDEKERVRQESIRDSKDDDFAYAEAAE